MKKKEKYSLTASQRKQKRNAGQQDEQPEVMFEDLPEDEQMAILAKQEQRKQKMKSITRLVAIILAGILAVGLITTGTVLYIKNNTIDNEVVNPVATIELSDGRELKMDLFYNKAPAIVANFIYLALNDYYKDTIFNATSKDYEGILAMSGYTTDSYKHKSKNIDFVQGLSGFTDHSEPQSGKDLFKLGYRFKYVNNDPGSTSRRGYMAFMSGPNTGSSNTQNYATATSYLFVGKNSFSSLNYGTSTNIINSITYMGKLHDDSLAIMDNIMALDDLVKDTVTQWHYANPNTYPDLKIQKITISKLNRSLKNKILNNFEAFVLSNGEGTLDGFSNWRTTASQLPS